MPAEWTVRNVVGEAKRSAVRISKRREPLDGAAVTFLKRRKAPQEGSEIQVYDPAKKANLAKKAGQGLTPRGAYAV
jgi:hypothetical protein